MSADKLCFISHCNACLECSQLTTDYPYTIALGIIVLYLSDGQVVHTKLAMELCYVLSRLQSTVSKK